MGQGEITVLTYNVKNCQGGRKINEIAAEIAGAGAQIVFMQEVDCKTGRSAGKDEAKRIAEELGFAYAFFTIMEYDGGLYGNAIFSAFPLSDAVCTPLPVPGKMEPRALGQADITIGGKPIRLFVTHLSYEDTLVRAQQFARVSKALDAAPGGSFLLGGDFNTSSYDEYALLPGAVPAHDAPIPGIRRIDNIFCDPAKALRNVRSVPTGYSDHDLVLAELIL
ncbi:MAG: endonuclease/exonuclease/phosphatase family protein [Oscillospiraceae bacterium]|nr:endonuclease/exonuclease/phosphatase family protein [Oscillospiraceae bacterium]